MPNLGNKQILRVQSTLYLMKPILRVLWSSNGRGQGRSRRTERQQYLWLKGGTRRLECAPGMVPTRCSPNICTVCRTAPLTRCWHGAFQELEPVQPPMRYRHMCTFTVLWGKKKKIQQTRDEESQRSLVHGPGTQGYEHLLEKAPAIPLPQSLPQRPVHRAGTMLA